MSVLNIQEQLTGGESVYCINQAQMSRTRDMLFAENSTGERLRSILDDLECRLSRNERAALAFTIIERLKDK
ncbi:MAG: hypothetical protein B0D92_01165 [Spirochaeta sp. LUC14_002_19_P3]|nr:MAG: hypothetical protein B0D92_01165 [Spirochaeta sp. LUC14_002_19_P3]